MAGRGVAGWVLRGVLLLVAFFVLVQAYFAACILYYRWYAPGETAFMAQRLDELREKNPKATIRYTWVPYARISNHLKRAVIAAEDAKFLEHDGFDWEGIAKAREKNEKKGRVVAGGSTITQQLAKNLYLSPSRSPGRKVVELFTARRLEAELPKRRIFELYLNLVEWGDGIWGAEAASQSYFGVPASDLTAEQAALLAGALINPRVYSPANPNRRLLQRQQIILRRMQ